jgi:probable phosphoglycerate mutase
LTRSYNEIVAEWSAGNLTHTIPGGESAADLQYRLEQALDILLQRKEQHLLVCTHGRTLRGLVCLLRGWGLTRMEEIEHSNTGLYHYEYADQRFTERVTNSTAHLAGV